MSASSDSALDPHRRFQHKVLPSSTPERRNVIRTMDWHKKHTHGEVQALKTGPSCGVIFLPVEVVRFLGGGILELHLSQQQVSPDMSPSAVKLLSFTTSRDVPGVG